MSKQQEIYDLIKKNSGCSRNRLLALSKINPKTFDRWVSILLLEKKITRKKDARTWNYEVKP